MKLDNPLWGTRRIRDELVKLSFDVSHESVRRVIAHFRRTGDIKPSGSWKRFLSRIFNSCFATDFATIDFFGLSGFKRYYLFFIIELKSRKIVQRAITPNPSIQFLRNQLSSFEYEFPNSYLIHDNSGEFRFFSYQDYQFTSVPTVPYSPNMNAYTERFVRSIRNECLDHFIIFSYKQLHNIVKEYINYYNNFRPHQGIKAIPNAPPKSTSSGEIRKQKVLFGLHRHYFRDAV